ncbi:hypothetical protein TREMEDRAFT_70323 [Tremella mesenterica DSM 1558]|uniref:uncharacterized protein n=1 Tax=Tremella mesenterica (strain ATCC 24925 / CBS 8224 / DSM 1558 / NBRC 9311 / NRRL Y-6157 / RJB 2259-6 / UBC 559-6) TaxID=578456 RepID=UPI00032C3409|nr:uncharacterized protein TREMEDRAFT_70323 [Tremella mesenterica DSM 1558]EIW66067.1 hypothetical protein TREMEDRAFT_70323 [Tremella mesenterica DSM 1558]
MVRISIPTLPPTPLLPPTKLSLLPLNLASQHLSKFIQDGKGKTGLITGAGVSVDSGIRAYRGKEGHYTNPNYTPILYHELVENSPRGEIFRSHIDWARSFLGYPPVRDALPNPTHIYIAALQVLGLAPKHITQNVDNLHPKAISIIQSLFPSTFPAPPRPTLLELHGTLAKVHCLEHRHEQSRDDYQQELADMNPVWNEEAKEAERTGRRPRTNPDGDVDLRGVDYTSFRVPGCRICRERGGKEGIVKPNVVFFGETLTPQVRDQSLTIALEASRLLVLGTSLATYSAFRLVKQASESDGLKGVEKMDRRAGEVLRTYLDDVLTNQTTPEYQAVKKSLDKGIIKLPPDVEGPRAEG